MKFLFQQDGKTSKSAMLLTLGVSIIGIILIIWTIQGALTPEKVKESGLLDWFLAFVGAYLGDRYTKAKGKPDA